MSLKCLQRKFIYHKFHMTIELSKSTAGDWDCVAAVERLPAHHHSVGFIFLSFGIMGLIVEL